jgi:hypothetical protein
VRRIPQWPVHAYTVLAGCRILEAYETLSACDLHPPWGFAAILACESRHQQRLELLLVSLRLPPSRAAPRWSNHQSWHCACSSLVNGAPHSGSTLLRPLRLPLTGWLSCCWLIVLQDSTGTMQDVFPVHQHHGQTYQTLRPWPA